MIIKRPYEARGTKAFEGGLDDCVDFIFLEMLKWLSITGQTNYYRIEEQRAAFTLTKSTPKGGEQDDV